jgi:hypothetical protein
MDSIRFNFYAKIKKDDLPIFEEFIDVFDIQLKKIFGVTKLN